MARANTLRRWRGLGFCLLWAVAGLAQASSQIAIVVDDLGNQWRAGLSAINIPFVQTLGIMPGRPFTEALAQETHRAQKTVIVHAPMSNQRGLPLGPLGLDRREGREQLLANLLAGLDGVPYAEGLSNHMGSELTRDAEAMGWVMSELKTRQLFFFDSLTIADSQGWRVADSMGVPWSRRRVFLDHERTPEFLAQQWQQALAIARRQGNVTIICHPYPETLAFFASLDPADYPDIEWVSLKPLLHQPQPLPIEPEPDPIAPDDHLWVERPHGMPKGS
ncbi:hypothetical protein BGP77_00435 [Saccharospirillum sp. MSK14-1]|uniref:divergent polysaccharide deacetylase family protein n=1 Tax=Saccharospirillum sp. MSK14-1 TaxID=1897632 RepID=UPI000D35F165|nr:divergent polysaccharide deacetylase family protein [Saccharospirillum sp. MSK14-1]PTY35833.1 hypothetical protein BGP77_00435 [Saccharospirillum sp. MSK14-1]